MGYTPLWAGIAVMPVGILPVIFAFYVSRAMQKYDVRYLIIFSFIVFGVTNYLFSFLYSQISAWYILKIRFWQGLGLAFFFLPIIQMSLLKIKKEDYAGASGLFHFVRILVGSGIGTSLSITFFSRHIQRFHADIGEHLLLGRPEVQSYFAFVSNLNVPFEKAKLLLDQTLNQEAAVLAFDNYMWLSAVLFFVSIPLILLCKSK
jgi:DHA2 family multidrug resistance protein